MNTTNQFTGPHAVTAGRIFAACEGKIPPDLAVEMAVILAGQPKRYSAAMPLPMPMPSLTPSEAKNAPIRCYQCKTLNALGGALMEDGARTGVPIAPTRPDEPAGYGSTATASPNEWMSESTVTLNLAKIYRAQRAAQGKKVSFHDALLAVTRKSPTKGKK